MRTAESWLMEYGESHRHPTNILIHKVCVPIIVYTLLALFWSLPFPWRVDVPFITYFSNWAGVLIFFCLIFYFSLGLKPGIFMTIYALPALIFLKSVGVENNITVAKIAGTVFIIAWIGQFIGHKVEGKKPSFLKDLLYLLIGPLWVFRPLWNLFCP